MLCVLSLTQAAAQEVTVKKVDQHAPPPPEEVDDDVRDRLVVTDEQGGRGLAVSVFLLSHIGFILRRFFSQLLFPSLSYLGKHFPFLLLHPSSMTLLHIPQPTLPMVRERAPQSGHCTTHPGRANPPQLTALV